MGDLLNRTINTPVVLKIFFYPDKATAPRHKMFKPVGNLKTNNGKRLVKWGYGQIKLGRAEPLWFDCVARLHPPLSFASAPCGHRLPNETASLQKPEQIVFPEDRLVERVSDGQAPIAIVDAPIITNDNHDIQALLRDKNSSVDKNRLHAETEKLSSEYLREEAESLNQSIRLKNLRMRNKK